MYMYSFWKKIHETYIFKTSDQDQMPIYEASGPTVHFILVCQTPFGTNYILFFAISSYSDNRHGILSQFLSDPTEISFLVT